MRKASMKAFLIKRIASNIISGECFTRGKGIIVLARSIGLKLKLPTHKPRYYDQFSRFVIPAPSNFSKISCPAATINDDSLFLFSRNLSLEFLIFR